VIVGCYFFFATFLVFFAAGFFAAGFFVFFAAVAIKVLHLGPLREPASRQKA